MTGERGLAALPEYVDSLVQKNSSATDQSMQSHTCN